MRATGYSCQSDKACRQYQGKTGQSVLHRGSWEMEDLHEGDCPHRDAPLLSLSLSLATHLRGVPPGHRRSPSGAGCYDNKRVFRGGGDDGVRQTIPEHSANSVLKPSFPYQPWLAGSMSPP
ncbi:hypothetical protein SKAU_G00389570 [Synaphobranchus kaupii]|uniref:Uncharacterized protein n=1 Tax=Synaphobranchus kaupii TaxID=118154 RepID=A0A9Q1EBB9_SYNKA|nr:hypothetical protein SKAU_G00389570 [Synaphobranchus kaupii]